MPAEDIQSWSPTAASNATADTGINWAEGQPRASVNNSARSMMAAHAKDRNLKNGSITTGGTANAQTFTSGVAYTAVPTGLTVRLKVGVTNTGATTLNMDGIGAVAIKDQAGSDIGANALLLGRYVDLLYNGTNWILLSLGAAAAPFDALAYNGMQINGSMEVSQENGTAVVPLTSGVGKHIVDGFIALFVGTGTLDARQNLITSLPGFSSCIYLNCSVANPLAGANDAQLFLQYIEGYRWSRLVFGTASAQPVTIGFWVYPNIVGTMAVSVRNGALNRSYVVDVPLAAASVWQYKTVTIPGDVAGAWDTANGRGAMISFCFGAGSAFKTAANTWTAGSFAATSATTNFFATTGTNYITGVVVLPGSDAPSAARSPFIMRPYDQELITCKRYFQQSFVINSNDGVGGGMAVVLHATRATTSGQWPVEMRAAPSLTTYSPASGAPYFLWFPGVADIGMSLLPQVTPKGWGPFFDAVTSNLLPIGQTGVFSWRADARL